jgi:hypothetical protein
MTADTTPAWVIAIRHAGVVGLMTSADHYQQTSHQTLTHQLSRRTIRAGRYARPSPGPGRAHAAWIDRHG